jgi:hypothetical protein
MPYIAEPALLLIPTFHKLEQLSIPVTANLGFLANCPTRILTLYITNRDEKGGLPSLPRLEKLAVINESKQHRLFPTTGPWLNLSEHPTLTWLMLRDFHALDLHRFVGPSSAALTHFIGHDLSGNVNRFFSQIANSVESIAMKNGSFPDNTTYEFPRLRSLALIEAGMLYDEQYDRVLPPCPQLERLHLVSTNETAHVGAILEPFVLAYGSTLESIYATFDGDVANIQALSPQDIGALAWCRRLRYLWIDAPNFFCPLGAKIFSQTRPVMLKAVVSALPPSQATNTVQSSACHSRVNIST